MKRKVYILSSIVLWLLLSLLAHAFLEIWYINLLVEDFDTWSFGMSWEMWEAIHFIVAVILLIVGAKFGYWLGVRWWQIIYVERRHWCPWLKGKNLKI